MFFKAGKPCPYICGFNGFQLTFPEFCLYKIEKSYKVSFIGNNCMPGIPFLILQVIKVRLDELMGLGHKKN